MVFEVRSSTEVATGPAGRVVRIGGRCRADAVAEVSPPSLLAGGVRLAPHEGTALRVAPAWSPFALTYSVPPDVPAYGWLLEVAPPSNPELVAAGRALEAIEAIHARLDLIEARVTQLIVPRGTDSPAYHSPLTPGGVS
jgi:hypothetical protein